jgi:hypothetical protein
VWSVECERQMQKLRRTADLAVVLYGSQNDRTPKKPGGYSDFSRIVHILNVLAANHGAYLFPYLSQNKRVTETKMAYLRMYLRTLIAFPRDRGSGEMATYV